MTFTTPVYTLNVVPSEAELAAAKARQEEEEATKKRLEEEAAKKKQGETRRNRGRWQRGKVQVRLEQQKLAKTKR
ncbi:MAG TPA: hypothetical protein VK680_11510 [Solirubrobacteraceae bacterium]|jgi:hypothetical protein|nr:hypothetical protein [Solirubrobacteraceae bacterium]